MDADVGVGVCRWHIRQMNLFAVHVERFDRRERLGRHRRRRPRVEIHAHQIVRFGEPLRRVGVSDQLALPCGASYR
jgi:hypothetical protein